MGCIISSSLDLNECNVKLIECATLHFIRYCMHHLILHSYHIFVHPVDSKYIYAYTIKYYIMFIYYWFMEDNLKNVSGYFFYWISHPSPTKWRNEILIPFVYSCSFVTLLPVEYIKSLISSSHLSGINGHKLK